MLMAETVPGRTVPGMTGSVPDGRIPSLDGIRAVAILLTIGHHLTERYFGVAFNNPLIDTLNKSGDGVGMFFVLSGFLITTLLLREYQKTANINFGDFYLHRIFRIIPPLYAYLIFYVAFSMFVGVGVHWWAVCSAALFYLDYSPQHVFWATQHIWSLSIEEQFYILWPIIFLTALHFGKRRAAAFVAAGLIILTPVSRIVTEKIHIAIFLHRQNFMLHTRMDSLMCGCLVAVLAGTPAFEKLYGKIEKYWWIAALYTFFLSGFLTHSLGFAYTNTIGLTVDSACIALLILWLSRNKMSAPGRVLNTRLMIKIGVLSYSAYIWQTFFIYYDLNANVPAWLCTLPMRLILIMGAAWLSYVVVEKPSLMARRAIVKFIEARRSRRSLTVMPTAT